MAEHGTNSSYVYWRCRCCDCVAAYKAYQKEYAIKNREAKIVKMRKWREENGRDYENNRYLLDEEYRLKKILRTHCRRALQASAIEPSELKALLESHNYLCVYCDAPYQHIDHIVPLSRGGTHEIGNLAPACARCNLSKGSKMLSEWKP